MIASTKRLITTLAALFASYRSARDVVWTLLGGVSTGDFIIVHESAHEWFGNNITSKDNADMWVHESFANYAEGIYTECQSGKQAGADYIAGNRRGIRNDRPIIPAYGVNDHGSCDMYPKGGEMLHNGWPARPRPAVPRGPPNAYQCPHFEMAI